MKKILLNNFEEYENMKKINLNIKDSNFSPTVLLPLIYNNDINFEDIDTIRKVNAKKDNSEE
ncbi:hypothetical protein, partial [Methanobrevibacter sp.]